MSPTFCQLGKGREITLLQLLGCRHCDRSFRNAIIWFNIQNSLMSKVSSLCEIQKKVKQLPSEHRDGLKCISWSGFSFFLNNILYLGLFVSCFPWECEFLSAEPFVSHGVYLSTVPARAEEEWCCIFLNFSEIIDSMSPIIFPYSSNDSICILNF